MVRNLNGEKTNFEEALTRFQDFLQANQYSGEIVWVQPENVLLTGKKLVYVHVSQPDLGEKQARRVYEEGMARQLGVRFGTICELGTRTCAYAWAPKSRDESARALMPTGLKLSAKTDKIKGICVNSGIWWKYLSARYSGRKALKEELFCS